MKNRMKNFIKQNKFNIIVITFYSIITFIILWFHESWRDEAQAWLIAKNLNIFGIFKQLTFEGHPPLWYLILHPFARIGLPYQTTKIISWAISVMSSIFILWKSPFNKKTKVLLLFSSPMIYMYPAISRSYCLIPLAIFLAAYYYNKRHKMPIKYAISIIFLANTHVILYGMVGILVIMFCYEEFIKNRKINSKEEKRKIFKSFIIMLIGLAITLIPIAISVLNNKDVSMASNLALKTYRLKDIFVIVVYTGFIIAKDIFVENYIWLTCVLFLIFYEVKFYRKNTIILLITLGLVIFFNSFVYEP